MEEDPDYPPPEPNAETHKAAVLNDWLKADAGNATRLARVAARIGGLDDRLRRGTEGWRHRIAMIEAADLSWFVCAAYAPLIFGLCSAVLLLERRSMSSPGSPGRGHCEAIAGWA